MALGNPKVTSAPASAESENQDQTMVSSRAAVVVDGAGIPKFLRTGCSHSVAWYARMIATTFHGFLLKPGLPLRAALGKAIAEVASRHRDTCNLAAGSPSAAVAAWRIRESHLEYLVLGDCSVLLRDHMGHCGEVTDRRLDALVEPQVNARQRDLTDEKDLASELLAARRAAVEAGRNMPGGFWCAQHDPDAARHALTGRRALSKLGGVVLATDGATRGLHLLRVHELDRLAACAVDGAHTTVLREIRAAEHDARAALTARGVKVHDDATLVSLRLP